MTYSKRFGASVVAVILLALPLFAFAAEFRTGDQPSLSEGEVFVGDLYMAGGNVTVSGSVRGDLIATGGNILLSGPVSADLAAAGGSVSGLGNVSEIGRVAGGNIV